MKNIFILILVVLPMLLLAQEQNNYLEYTKREISKTQINTKNSDFGPAFVKNELWYSAYSEKEIQKLSNGNAKGVFYDSYITGINADGDLLDGKELAIEEISHDFHSGPVSYCEASQELFVTLSNFDNPDSRNRVYKKSDIRLRIVVLKKNNGIWELVEEMPFNDPTYSVGHPAISKTGDTIFYSSNNPSTSLGRTDLYMSIRTNGEWGEPINLGENINTERTEMFPTFFQNNTLIFSSDKSSETGLDLYYSVLGEDGFSKPIELADLNSTEDDFGLVIHGDEKLGYFVSNRTGGTGNDDIYKVSFEGLYKLELLVIDEISGKVVQKPKVKFDDGGSVQLEGNLVCRPIALNTSIVATSDINGYTNDSKTITTVNKPFGVIRDTLYVFGDYEFELLVIDRTTGIEIPKPKVKFSDAIFGIFSGNIVSRILAANSSFVVTTEIEGYMNGSKTITSVNKPFGIIRDTIYVEKVAVGQTFVMENIFYDFDKWDILPESEVELNKLVEIMNANPGWKVELGSHTDSRGNDAYNKSLSQKRSKSAVNYIISAGINEDRIVAKGYGETQLVNKCTNGVSCSDADHRKNRRTEFKIIDL